MTTIFDLKGLLKSARDDLNVAKSTMLDKECQEILVIIDCVNELAEQSDKGPISAVPVGLYAITYYLAGVAINIARVTMPVASYLDRKPKRAPKTTGFAKAYKPIFRKLLECQEMMTYFADAINKDCCAPIDHVASQIMVLLEHPNLMLDSESHRCLSSQLELVEELSDRMFTIYQRFENHSLLKIDVSLIPEGIVDSCGVKQMSQPIKLNTSVPEGYHPQPNDKGQPVPIKKPSKATQADTWSNPDAVATVTAHDAKALPDSLFCVAFTPWRDAPTTLQEWANVDGQNIYDEPDFESTKGLKQAAGVVIQEDDGRVWIVHPTNAFGGYQATFPKGTLEDCLPFQASAIKEAYEESGLKVEITGFIGDFKRSTSVARYYTAKRVGGSPAAMGWESQGVSLVPVDMLGGVVNSQYDIPLINAIGKARERANRPN